EPLARRRRRGRGRARGGARPDAAARPHPRLRPHRGAARGGRDDARAAERRDHPDRARVRLPGLLRRPRAAVALRDRAGGRGAGLERPVPELLANAGTEPVLLEEKEGLALINGTDGMLGMLLMAIADLDELVRAADLTTALSVQGLRGRDTVFHPELHAPLRP